MECASAFGNALKLERFITFRRLACALRASFHSSGLLSEAVMGNTLPANIPRVKYHPIAANWRG